MYSFRLTETSTIKASEIVGGQVYVAKDGRMLLYLGRDARGLYVFYFIGLMALRECSYEPGVPERGRWLAPINEAYLMPYYRSMLTEAMGGTPDRKCLTKLSKIPNLVGHTTCGYGLDNIREFFSRVYEQWGAEAIRIAELYHGADNSQKGMIKKECSPVKEYELIPGRVYVASKGADLGTNWEGHRATYLYLGKVKNKYGWLFVGWCRDAVDGNGNPRAMLSMIEQYAEHPGNGSLTEGMKKVYEPVYYAGVNKFRMNKEAVDELVQRLFCYQN